MRTDAEKRAEQTTIARKYQADTAKKRGQRDGVIVTPVEIVDFQIRAVIDLLARQGRTLADPQVTITDPFGGTGIYCARLMQLSNLTPNQLADLYHHRMRVIEIDKDAAEIAAKNLANVFFEETGLLPLGTPVICTDTFALRAHAKDTP